MRYTEILEACWKGYRRVGMKKKGDRMVPNCVPVSEEQMEEDLRKWFKEKWVRFGPDGKIRGDCARGSEGEGKPKCLPQAKAHALGKKGRASAAAKKRREDPNPERRGPARNVATKVNEFAISKGEDDPNDLTDEAFKDGQRLGFSLVDGATRAQGFEASRYLDRYLVPFSYGWNAGRKMKIKQAQKDGVALTMKKDGSLVRAEQGVAEASFTAAASMHAATRKQDPQRQEPKHDFRVGDKIVTKKGNKPGEVVFVDGEKIHVKGTNPYYPNQVTYHTASELKKGVAEDQLQEKQDACYRKVKSRYKVWPSAYASGALVQCRKKGAANWGNKSKK